MVAHEIAHSWSGNLVTNKNFEHFWLNEGFTVFSERKIIGRMQGEVARHFAGIGGTKNLHDGVRSSLLHLPHIECYKSPIKFTMLVEKLNI